MNRYMGFKHNNSTMKLMIILLLLHQYKQTGFHPFCTERTLSDLGFVEGAIKS